MKAASSTTFALSLSYRFVLLTATLLLLTLAMHNGLQYFFSPLKSFLVTCAVMLPLSAYCVHQQLQSILSLFRAMTGVVTAYQDGEYSFSLNWSRQDELRDLVDAHNALGDVLRKQRLNLAQRELLLDTMVQNTPVAMLLISALGPVVYANIAARQLLNHGQRLEGHTLAAILQRAHPAFVEAVQRNTDGLFSVPETAPAEDEIFHLTRRHFSLNGRQHELLLLRHLTNELRREEVKTWKKIFRVISHELNNSLAPIASLANSASELVRRNQYDRLPEILSTIAERSAHLEGFILSYASFAKLPTPRPTQVSWQEFLAQLAQQISFKVNADLPDTIGYFDSAQLQLALINLLKNAHESGSPTGQIELTVKHIQDCFRIDIMDRGPGMSEAVLTHALVPFYSTKRSGTGLGLALAREIIEAHDGRIALANRQDGGLTVSLILPLRRP